MAKTKEVNFNQEGTAYITKEECQITPAQEYCRERFNRLVYDLIKKYNPPVSKSENPAKSIDHQ